MFNRFVKRLWREIDPFVHPEHPRKDYISFIIVHAVVTALVIAIIIAWRS